MSSDRARIASEARLRHSVGNLDAALVQLVAVRAALGARPGWRDAASEPELALVDRRRILELAARNGVDSCLIGRVLDLLDGL